MLYGTNLTAVSLSLRLIRHLAVRYHRRRGLGMAGPGVRRAYRRAGGGAALAAVGVALAWVSLWTSYGLYLLSPAAYVVVQVLPAPRRRRRRPAAVQAAGAAGR